ncbi:MAG: hypothetical protein PVG53_06315, partial [Holophagae bacterium]
MERAVSVLDVAPDPDVAFRERDRERDRDRSGRRSLTRLACLTSMLLFSWSARAADIDLTGRISPQASVTTYQ